MPQNPRVPNRAVIRLPPTSSAPRIFAPEADPNRALGENILSDIGDFGSGVLGFGFDPVFDGPEELKKLSTASKAGSAVGMGAMLPWGKAKGVASALMRRAGLRLPEMAAERATVGAAERALANRVAPEASAARTNLPAEFQAAGAEQEAYNAARKAEEAATKAKFSAPKEERMQMPPQRNPRDVKQQKHRVLPNPEPLAEKLGDTGVTTTGPKENRPMHKGPDVVEQRGLAISEYPDNMMPGEEQMFDAAITAKSRVPATNVNVQGTNAPIPWEQKTFGELGTDGAQDFMRDLNKLNLEESAQSDAMRGALNQYDRSVDERMREGRAKFRTSYPDEARDIAALSTATQRDLPISGAPLISYNPADFTQDAAQKAGQHLEELHKLAMAEDPRIPEDLTKLVRRMDLDGSGVKGNYQRYGKQLRASSGDTIDTVGHEYQHAKDELTNPSLFDNYPDMRHSSLLGTPRGYYSHPSEVRARTGGALSKLMEEAKQTGQLPLPKSTLEPFGHNTEALKGDVEEALLEQIKIIEGKKALRRAADPIQGDGYKHTLGLYNFNQPRQRGLPFEFTGGVKEIK